MNRSQRRKEAQPLTMSSRNDVSHHLRTEDVATQQLLPADCPPCRALGVPVTDHTYEDCRLMISAGELTLPMEAGLVEFTKISRKLK